MNKYLRILLLSLLILSLGTSAFPGVKLLPNPENIESKDLVSTLDKGWRYHSGDNPAWADPDYDASDWELVNDTQFDKNSLPESGFEGVGWFRLTVDVDSTYLGKPYAVDMHIFGAAQMYINGKFVEEWGEIRDPFSESQLLVSYNLMPRIIQLDNQPKHVIAVRFVNQRYAEFFKEGGLVGFSMKTANPWDYQKFLFWFSKSPWGVYTYMNGFAVAIGLLHLLLFLFFPKERSNLYYSILLSGLVLIMVGTNPYYEQRSLEFFLKKLLLFKTGLIITAVFSAVFIFSIFREKLPKIAFYVMGAGVVALATIPFLPVNVYYIFALAIYPITLTELLIAWRKKKKGVYIVIDGTFIAIFFFVYQMLGDLGVIQRFLPYLPEYQEYLAGVFVLVLTNSVFLAWSVGRTNRDLGARLEEVKELNEKTLQQERKAREEELRVKSLEMENVQKDLRLREAAKREELMEKLEDTNHELELMNQELIQTQSQLVQSEKMASLGMLTAGIAHEINTPIGAMSSVHGTMKKATENLHEILKTEMGDRYEDNEKLQKSLHALLSVGDVIKSGGDRVTTIVKRMKSFARLDESDFKKSDIHVGLEDTLLMINYELKSGIEVEKEYGEIPEFECHPSQLNQVFLNLMMNSIQAMKGKGKLSIKTWVQDHKAHIAISDTGLGMSKEVQAKIFDPGFTTKGVGVGTGLGLSICYNIIKDHKGEIRVQSEPGKGSTFTVVVPLISRK